MRTFTSYFILELKRFLGIRNKIIIVLVLVLSLGFIQSGVSDYKQNLTLKDEFQKFENLKVSQFLNYRQYGAYGSRMLFVSAPFSVFFINSGIVPEMTAYIDGGERLKIYNPMIGKNIFGIKKFGFTDFSGILLFFGSLLALFYGYETLYYKEYLKSLASFSSRLPLFFSLLVSRVLMISLLLLILIGSALLLMLFNGLPIPIDSSLLNFVISILMISIFFFLLGTALGTTKSKLTGIPTLLSCWFLLLFIIPAAIDNYIENKANFIKPLYLLEMEKLTIALKFEKEVLDKELSYRYGEKPTEPLKERILLYWNKEFKKINGLEQDMLNQMRENLSHLQGLSTLFPTTNYLSVVNELSSRGYENLLDFYDYAQKLKGKYVKNFIDKVYFSNFSKVEPLLKGEENIYYARSRLPGTFVPGVLITLCYIVLLTWVTYIRYKRILYILPAGSGENRQHPDLKLFKGQYRIFSIESSAFLNRLYNLFSGQTNLRFRYKKKQEWNTPRIYIDDIDISKQKSTSSFLYLCSPENLPGDIKAVDFFGFFSHLTRRPATEKSELFNQLNLDSFKKKRISQLKKQKRAELLLSLTRMHDTDIYLFYDIARGMTRVFTVQFKDRMHELSEAGKLVLYLTTDTIISEEILEDNTGFIESTSNWTGMVESVRY